MMSENMQFVKLAGMPQYIRYLAIEIFSNWLSSLLGKQSQVSVKYEFSIGRDWSGQLSSLHLLIHPLENAWLVILGVRIRLLDTSVFQSYR